MVMIGSFLAASVSVQCVFIKIESLTKPQKKRENNIQKALISSNKFPNNKYVE